MHISCGGKSHGNWRSGKEHAAHLAHHQHHTGHRWGSYFDSMSLPQNVGCDTKSETSCTTDDITRQVEKHVFGKDVRQMSDQSSFGRKSTPVVIRRAFAVVFSWISFRKRCPILPVSLLRSTTKRLRSTGAQCCSFCLKIYNYVRPSWQKEYGLTSDHWIVYSAACQHVRPFSFLCSCWI